MIMTWWSRFLRRTPRSIRAAPTLRISQFEISFRRSAVVHCDARLNQPERFIKYASRHNLHPKRLLFCVNYSLRRFDVLENCRDTRDGRRFIIQQTDVVGTDGVWIEPCGFSILCRLILVIIVPLNKLYIVQLNDCSLLKLVASIFRFSLVFNRLPKIRKCS